MANKRRRYCFYRGLCMLFLTAFLSGCASEGDSGKVKESEGDVVLSAFVQQSVSSESGIWKGWAAQKLYEDTSIKVDFYPTGSQVEEKLRQYIAAGTLPDIIGFRDTDQARMAIEAGLLLPLDEYQESLPGIFNSKEYQEAVGYSAEYYSNGSGKLFIMPTSIGSVHENDYSWMPMLQWDAYKKAGSPEITTLEDYLDVVERMVKTKPVNKYGKKVYGFSLFSDWDMYSALEVAALSYFYGIDTEYVSPLMETNVITKETTSILSGDSFYKRALHFYFEANQRGLLDPDSMTQSYSNIRKKYDEGRIMFSWYSWLPGAYNGISSGNVNNQREPDGYVHIPAADMKIYEAPDQSIGRNWYFAISKNCKSVEKACEFINWLYEPEVQRYLYNGPEGGIWEYNASGEPEVTAEGWEIIDDITTDMPLAEGGSFQSGTEMFNALGLQAATVMEDGYSISYQYWPETLKLGETLVQGEVNKMLGADSISEYLHQNDMTAKSTNAVNMLTMASDEMKGTISAIGEAVRDKSWKMVYAHDEAEFESLWSDMVSQADALGLDEVEKYYKKAWDEAVKHADLYE